MNKAKYGQFVQDLTIQIDLNVYTIKYKRAYIRRDLKDFQFDSEMFIQQIHGSIDSEQ